MNGQRILVTGACGFLGSHFAAHLRERYETLDIRTTDQIYPNPTHLSEPSHPYANFVAGDLRERDFCLDTVRDRTMVLHFAANMGGMGTIHEENEFRLHKDNLCMDMNLLHACLATPSVKTFFYASSACVYTDKDVADATASFAESDAWPTAGVPPRPQGLYGLEKLQMELVLAQPQIPNRLDIRIARFHNIFGERGTWHGGREKAPAALLRKALAVKLLREIAPREPELEIWGDGQQRRSFLHIDDCVQGVFALLTAPPEHSPLNIGSDRAITIEDLARIALRVVGAPHNTQLNFRVDANATIGVASRNSDNTFALQSLGGWRPQVLLEEGMRRTGEWMENMLRAQIAELASPEQAIALLERASQSIVLSLNDVVTYNVLLPITSRGSIDVDTCLSRLAIFAQTLLTTTKKDVEGATGLACHVKVYLGIDFDDGRLLCPSSSGLQGLNVVEAALHNAGIDDFRTIICHESPGHVCAIWRKLAREAWSRESEGHSYFVLMGDDIELLTDNWMSSIHAEFSEMSEESGLPFGFGCVAFEDVTFPGMPTFPVVHKQHLDMFNGEVVPEAFVNQDGDPYLFQLYRRWGCSRMMTDCAQLKNTIGGGDDARYEKESRGSWSFRPLNHGIAQAKQWLVANNYSEELSTPKISIDIVVPSYRVQLPILESIISLQPSGNVVTTYNIIIDDPGSSEREPLEKKYGHRTDVRIRTNRTNLGASASRNRGMRESSADFIAFLDDDIVPNKEYLLEVEKQVLAHPNAAGFVGNVSFPPAASIFTSAVHLSGVTYFWNIADKIQADIPWGVTANLVVRRQDDGVDFDLAFPKTGGGEDIDFCRRKCSAHPGSVFYAAPDVRVTHPWWANGRRTYWRFYGWGQGDSNLIGKYPEYRYRDFAPNSSEWLLISCLVSVGGAALRQQAVMLGLKLAACTLVANVAHDYYRHFIAHEFDVKTIPSQSPVLAQGWRKIVAVGESALIRMASEGGKTIGLLKRGEWHLFGMRFDWFTGKWGNGPRDNERKNNLQRMIVIIALLSLLLRA